jgi:molybdate transport system substrate-binding protein
MRSRGAALAILAAACTASGCSGGGQDRLDVFAASSLVNAFPAYAERFRGPSPAFSFAGSDQLAAQIRQGVGPDVFASADTSYPAALHRAGLVGDPVDFATNRLVIAVPTRSSPIRSLASLARADTRLAIGTPSVPAGAYAREVLGRLPPRRRRAILANVADQEPSVAGIVAKLAEGAIDAGLVYATDVSAANGRLRGIPLPARLRPKVVYAAAVVRGSSNAAAARRFIRGLRHGAGRTALRAAGFGPPPRR